LDPEFIASLYLGSLHFETQFQRHGVVFRLFLLSNEAVVNGDCQQNDLLNIQDVTIAWKYFYTLFTKCSVLHHNFFFG